MNIRCVLLTIGILLLTGCRQKDKAETGELGHRRFKTEVLLKTTPIKNQGESSLCWAYAMLATIETEHLMQGDSVNLSVDYVARQFLREQVMERCYTTDNDQQKKSRKIRNNAAVTTRGMSSMLPRLIRTYGLTHYDAYHRNVDDNVDDNLSPLTSHPSPLNGNYHLLCRKLEQLCGSPLSRHQDGIKAADSLLNATIGPAPRYVFMLGAEYSAIEFAHSVCRADEYESLTSFTHHTFNRRFPLEVPDNRYHDTFLNVPLDTMMATIDRALHSGHPVCWEGDTSEPGFNWTAGIAELEGNVATQQQRQRAFENGQTTDDHCMEIVGIAYEGKSKFYIMKNSWGTGNAYHGFILVSEPYVRMKTIAACLPAIVLKS